MDNALAAHAHDDLVRIWSPRENALYERDLWLTVMTAQRELGVAIPAGAIYRYRLARQNVDLARIAEIERVTRHDVKARLEHFNEVAGGYEYAHLGMTSADVVDNIAVIKLRDSLRYLAGRYELDRLDALADRLPWRGIKGAVGTQVDQVQLLGNAYAARQLDRRVTRRMGFDRALDNVSQVYPRSIEFEVVSTVQVEVARARPELPYRHLIAGYVSMMANAAGDTWNEGDVSQSVTRRVALPNTFFAADVAMRTR